MSWMLSAPPNLQLAPAQWWHLTGSTGTRSGPVQLNARDELPCVGSRNQSSIRPAWVMCVAGPSRYGIGAERSHGTCDSHRISLLKYEELFKKYLNPWNNCSNNFKFILSPIKTYTRTWLCMKHKNKNFLHLFLFVRVKLQKFHSSLQ